MIHQQSMIQRLTGIALATVLVGGLATGCRHIRSWSPFRSAEHGADKPQVVAGDGVLCDLTRTLATPAINVRCILSGGEDPHTFSLSPEHRSDLAQADLVLLNGLYLTPALAPLAQEGKALAVAEAIELPAMESDSLSMTDDHDEHDGHDDHGHHDHHGHDHGGVDPHVWHDPDHTRAMAVVITEELTRLVPKEAASLQALNQEATAVLQDLDAWTQQQVETIPPQQRVLATRHKAFGYYARRYGFKELPLLEFSSNEAVRPAMMANLQRELAKANVVVLFPEQNPPGQALLVMAEQNGIPLSPQHLSPDGLFPDQSTVETFVTNTCAITNGLQGQCDEAGGEALAMRWRTLADHAPAHDHEEG